MRKYIVFAFLLFALPALSGWNEFIKSEEEGVGLSWLKIAPGARGIALANAYLSIAEGPTAIWWNPAGLMKNNGWNAGFTYINYFMGTYEFLGVSNKSGVNAYGIALSGMFVGDMELHGEQPGPSMGNFDARNFLLSLSYAREIDEGLNVGVVLKGIYERIYIYELSSYLLDFGLIYTPYPNLWFGVTGTNFGPSPKFETEEIKPPLGWKIGASYKSSKFLFSIDANKYIDVLPQGGIGVEYAPLGFLSLRVGYIVRNKTQTVQPFSCGFGINWEGFKIDYAFKPYAYDIDASHIITLTK